MSEFPRLIWQYFLNWSNLADHFLNTLLFGDPYETLSARVARARMCGVKWANKFCTLLTWGQIICTLGKNTKNHADYALDAKIKPNCREILDLCHWPPRIRKHPVNEVIPQNLQNN